MYCLGDGGPVGYLRQSLAMHLRKHRPDSRAPEIRGPLQPYVAKPSFSTPSDRHSSTAGVRGAVFGIRLVRRTLAAQMLYGVGSDTRFLFGTHPLENLAYCAYTGHPATKHRIHWFL